MRLHPLYHSLKFVFPLYCEITNSTLMKRLICHFISFHWKLKIRRKRKVTLLALSCASTSNPLLNPKVPLPLFSLTWSHHDPSNIQLLVLQLLCGRTYSLISPAAKASPHRGSHKVISTWTYGKSRQFSPLLFSNIGKTHKILETTLSRTDILDINCAFRWPIFTVSVPFLTDQ